jgi:CRISPR-associated protein Csm2
MPGNVFEFSISDLGPVFGRNERDRKKEANALKTKFEAWGLADNARVSLTPDTLETIITDPDGTPTLVEWAEKLGTILKSLRLTTNQIRNIFGTVRQIEMSWTAKATEDERRDAARRLLLLKPRLAYQAEREKPVKRLQSVLSAAIDHVGPDRENFQRLVDFFEAILAYHTAAGGQ